MEFDYIRDKKYSISTIVTAGYSLETIKFEIAKCEVRCANCHRKKTFKQMGWYDKNDPLFNPIEEDRLAAARLIEPIAQAKGSKHVNSKLIESDIPKIRKLLAKKRKYKENKMGKFMTYEEIGSKFGVSAKTIHMISDGKIWKHVK